MGAADFVGNIADKFGKNCVCGNGGAFLNIPIVLFQIIYIAHSSLPRFMSSSGCCWPAEGVDDNGTKSRPLFDCRFAFDDPLPCRFLPVIAILRRFP
jgi:hypothetical protein